MNLCIIVFRTRCPSHWLTFYLIYTYYSFVRNLGQNMSFDDLSFSLYRGINILDGTRCPLSASLVKNVIIVQYNIL